MFYKKVCNIRVRRRPVNKEQAKNDADFRPNPSSRRN